MIMIPRLLILLVLFFTGCENVDESEKEKNTILTDHRSVVLPSKRNYAFNPMIVLKEEIIKDFPKPVNTYPLIDKK